MVLNGCSEISWIKMVVTRNKTRLVANDYSQEKRIDFDETFAHIARSEAIKIFLTYAVHANFTIQFISKQKFPKLLKFIIYKLFTSI